MLRRLILFDYVILQSVQFKEFPTFISDLGYDAVMTLLKSAAFKICCDFVLFMRPSSGAENALPLHHHSVSMMKAHNRKQYIHDCLNDLHELAVPLSEKQIIKLKGAIAAKLTEEPEVNYGNAAFTQTTCDLADNSPIIRTALALRLEQEYGIPLNEAVFGFRLHEVKDGLFRAESDLSSRFALSDSTVHELTGSSILAVADFNMRLEEMKTHSAISGFQEREVPLFGEKLRFLADVANAEIQEQRFQRVLSLLDLPDVPLDRSHFDMEEFLDVRNSCECVAFRDWLSDIDSWSDEELIERVRSIRDKFSGLFQGNAGKVVRLLVSSGIGLVPGAGLILGPLASILDTFLLDKIMRRSGALSFIDSKYPSLFR